MVCIKSFKYTIFLSLLVIGACNDKNNSSPAANTITDNDLTAPYITNLTVTEITETSAHVLWTTNEASSTQLEFGTTMLYGTNLTGDAYVLDHAITINNLSGNTLYHYRVTSEDGNGNSTSSSDAIFTTLTPTSPAPPAPPAPEQYNLTVTIFGAGVITSTPDGINCGSNCTMDYNYDTQVSLTPTAEPGYQFSSWNGACTSTSSCVITMNTNQTVTAVFEEIVSTDLNCTGPWAGSEETTTITAWPYRDCFRTDPIEGGRTRLSSGTGGEVFWDQGAGWNSQNALRVRPPDGSLGNYQGYAGLGEHSFHSIRTKQLNIRYLVRYNSNWAQYAQRNKWEVAIKYDYSNQSSPIRLEGCERGIAEGRSDPLDGAFKNFVMQQGVCTRAWEVPNLNGWNFGSLIRENEWISIENEFNLETGWYRTYISTQDGVFNHSLHSEINIGMGAYGAPAEDVPNPNWWGSIDCSAGCFWDWPTDLGIVPRPVDTYIWYSHFVMSNTTIGPPAGFIQ